MADQEDYTIEEAEKHKSAQYPVGEKKYALSERIDETPEVFICRFTPEDGKAVAFDPGMFFMISGIDAAGKRYVSRAFSIASDPASAVHEYFIVKEHLLGTAMHVSHLGQAQINAPFFLKGPYGQFRFDPNRDRKVIFIAGGTGLAPFMSMMRHMKELKSQTDVKLFYSVKFPTEIIRKGELKDFERQIKLNTTISVTRPQPGDGWTGTTGHINADVIKRYCPDFGERMCYICGPLAFVKAMKDALTALGIPTQRVSADVWG
ncbi:MAG: FAD-dependent oxidoreductase [Candidatus Marsarchaeota archaeon]|nr:FAD-dependent oxidoreductase [Candidatus Marsarchaeota archaeon]